MLFIVYINDLPIVPRSSKVFLFADDTKCKKKIQGLHDCVDLQEDLNLMGEWSNTWKLLFKEQKCALVRMCSSQPTIEHTYYINGKAIANRESYRDLGVIISSDLTWCAHHDHIIARAYRSLGLLRRTFNVIQANS